MKRNGARRTIAGRIALAIIAVFAIAFSTLQPISVDTAAAATSNSCTGAAADDQNNIRVTASHGKVFYIDSGQSQSLDAAYVSYIVQNRSASTALTNIWATVDTFTGGAVGLANPSDWQQPLGDIGASASDTAFFMLKATASSTKAQSHVVRVWSGKPGAAGSVELYSCTFSFAKVSETIKAAANKVTSIATTSVTTIGSTMTITVLGNTGTIGAGNSTDGSMIWISPAARSTWPTGALRLESTNFSLYSNNSRNGASFVASYANQLRVGVTSGSKYYYTAEYTFRITGVSAVTSANVIPVAQIASGTQIKHTDLSTISSSSVSPSASTVNLAVTKSVSSSVDVADGYTTLDYTVSLSNTGAAVAADSVTDQRDAVLSFVPGSAKYNGVTIADPGLIVGTQNSLVFSGPFAVPLGTSGTPTVRTLTYKMRVPTCSAGSFLYSNAATAAIGLLTVGSTASTKSVTRAGGTCGAPTLTTNTSTNEALPTEVITSPASSITTTAARVNGLVDPNGVSGQNIVFAVGTSSTLAGASSTTIGTTTTSTASYAVYQDLTGLLPGTLYYFRLSVDGVQGEILSFVTPEAAALPTATTIAATNVTTTTASINGSVDPNQVANGAKVKFIYATDSSSGACTTLGSTTTTGFVQSETDTGTEDAVLLGSFPSDVSIGLTGLTPNAYYCYKVVAYYNASSAVWDTAVTASTWVAFRASVKTAQTITFANPGTKSAGTSFAAGATASSSLTVTYSSNTPDVCSVSGSTITTIAAGTCSITAAQPGNDSFSAAEPVTVTFTVAKQPQTITFALPTSATAGDLVTLGGTTTALGLTVTYSAGPSGVCSIVSGNLQTGPGSGTCTVTASQAGNDAYDAAADVIDTIEVNDGPPVITTTLLADGTIDSAYSETLAAAGGDGSYSNWQLTSGVLPQGLFFNTATGEIWGTPTTAGTTNLEFTVDSASLTSIVRSLYITINKKTQTISAADFSRPYASTPVTSGASSSASLPLGYVSSDESVATVSGGMVAPVGVGTTTITVSAAGDSEYLAAADVTFVVTITPLTVTVTASSHSVTYGDASPSYSASYSGFASGEDESVLTTLPTCSSTYTSTTNAGSTPAVTCSGAVADNYVFNYAPGAVTIGKANQVITPTPNVLGEMVPGATQAFAASSSSGQTVTIVASGECTWLADVITASMTEGTCTVTASVPESTNYFAATDVVREAEVLLAAKANRTIALELDVPGPSHTLLANLTALTTLGPVASPIVYSVAPASAAVCSIDATTGVITLLGVGDCTIISSVDADADYNPAEATLTFAVTLAPRTLALVATPTTRVVGLTMALAATPSAGAGTITYALVSGSSHCSISGSTITAVAEGDCDVEATIAASGAYAAATSARLRLTVTAVAPTPTPSPTPTPTPSPTPSSSGPRPAPVAAPVLEVVEPTPTPTPVPTSDSASGGSTSTSTAVRAAGRLPQPTSTKKTVGDVAAPGAPARTGNSVDTVDFGRGIEPADTASDELSRAARTEAALLGETFSGFASGSGVIIQVTGSRTAAQFVVTPASQFDAVTITEAIAESRARLLANFAGIDGSTLESAPDSASIIGGIPTDDALRAFVDSGLPAPITVGQLDFASAQSWVRVTAHVDGYAPGTVVYLAVTTNPVIVGASLVSRTGDADIVGLVPADLLEAGGHNLRIIGTRVLSGITADESGQINIDDAAMAEIQRFDLGTQATVRLVGANDTGGDYLVVRIVQLNPAAPWWTVLLLGIVGLLLAAAVAAARSARRGWVITASIVLTLLVLLPEIAGWLTRSYDVMAWGVGVGVVVQVLLWGGRAITQRYRDSRSYSGAATA